MKIGICDDNTKDRDILLRFLKPVLGEHDVLEVYHNGMNLLDSNDDVPFDIVFLDVKMPNLGGIEVAQEIRNSSSVCQIILQTQYRDYGPESYSVQATDYLLKPLTQEAVAAAYRRASHIVLSHSEVIRIDAIGSTQYLFLNEIIYIEAFLHNLVIHTMKENVRVHGTLKEYVQKLKDKGFYRIHNSFFVNLSHITRIEGKRVWLGESITLPIGNTHKVTDLGQAVARHKLRGGGGNHGLDAL